MTRRGPLPKSPRSWAALVSLLLPGGTALTLLVVLGHFYAWDASTDPEATLVANVSGWAFALVFFLLIVAWILLPVAVAGYLLRRASRQGWDQLFLAGLGSVGVSALTIWAIHVYQTDESSTAALLFVVLPVLQSIPLLVASALTYLTRTVAQ